MKKLYSVVKIPLKTKFALKYYRRRMRRTDLIPTQRMSHNTVGATSILFLLPESPENIRTARHFLKSIKHSIPDDKEIRYLCNIAVKSEYDSIIEDNLHTYSEDYLTRWGLPQISFVDLLFQDEYDAVADLHAHFNPVTAFLVLRSGAGLRIGFNSEEADHYFNIVLDHSGTDFLEKGYRNLQKVLGI